MMNLKNILIIFSFLSAGFVYAETSEEYKVLGHLVEGPGTDEITIQTPVVQLLKDKIADQFNAYLYSDKQSKRFLCDKMGLGEPVYKKYTFETANEFNPIQRRFHSILMAEVTLKDKFEKIRFYPHSGTILKAGTEYPSYLTSQVCKKKSH